MELGGRILDAFPEMKVDVHKPEVLFQVEIRGDVINIYSIEVPGPGGMPIGTAGKAMLLLSGGIDSPVAGYMVAKRGVQNEATYFHAPPYTSERAKQKVIDLAKIVYGGAWKYVASICTPLLATIYPATGLSIPPDNKSIAFPAVPIGIPPGPGTSIE